MNAISALGFAAAAAVIAFTVRQFDPAAGRNIAIAAGSFIMLSLIANFSGAAQRIREIAEQGGVPPDMVTLIVKAVGIAYLSQLTSALCGDLGESSLAVTCEVVGKLLLTLLALPIVQRIAAIAIETVNAAF